MNRNTAILILLQKHNVPNCQTIGIGVLKLSLLELTVDNSALNKLDGGKLDAGWDWDWEGGSCFREILAKAVNDRL